MWKRGTRPARGEIDQAALALLTRHGGQIMATARRYAATPEDAEDAYQRGLEILLTKAPTTREDELIPWLKTVVKHESFALRRQRERHSPVTDDGHLSDRPTAPAITHDQAERLERLSHGAEALRELKPHEIRAMVLKAEGYSYREICEVTGWSYTKVNRLLVEGRQAFLARVASIQGGGECERHAPLLSALADGEAKSEDVAALRLHLKTCLNCRARLKEFREVPARVAALVPPAGLLAGQGDGLRGAAESVLAGVQQKFDTLMGIAQQRAASMGDRAHAVAELATGQKLAAVAASAAALAGGGTAIEEVTGRTGPPPRPHAAQVKADPVKEEVAVEAAPAPVAETPATTPAPAPTPTPAPAAPAPTPAPAPPPPPPPDPANEFQPGDSSGSTSAATLPAASAPAAPAPATSGTSGFAPAGGGGTGGGSGGGGAGGEFAP
jgi:RNA polymerase sigma factor (sigma-70 family)